MQYRTSYSLQAIKRIDQCSLVKAVAGHCSDGILYDGILCAILRTET